MFVTVVSFIIFLLVVWWGAFFLTTESVLDTSKNEPKIEEISRETTTKNKWLYPEENKITMHAGRAMDEEETTANAIPEKLAHHGDFQIIDKS